MRSNLHPIDNCEHQYEYDEVAEEEYCIHCGYVPDKTPGGWVEPSTDNS